MSDEPLQYFPPEKWGDLQSVFRKDWTRGVSAYAVLDTQRRWLAKGMDSNLKIYCPYGNIHNGMVAFNEKDLYYEIIIQCPSDDTSNLATALRTTKLIDWNKSVKVPFATRNVIDALNEIMDDVNVEVEEVFPYDTYILDTNKLYKDIRLPDGVIFKHLTTEHVNLIDSTWPYRYPSSDAYFEFLIKLKYGYGLYMNNSLITWVLVSEAGTLLHLYTVEEHRRKGYAEVLLKLVSNALLADGRVVIAYCVPDNHNASKLYVKSERWDELLNVFRKDWPRGVSGYTVLDNQKRWMAKGIEYDMRIYCPFGEVQNGMVALNEKYSFYEIIIQCPSDDTRKLAMALRTTKLIDWTRPIKVPFAPYNVINMLKEIVDDVNVQIELILPSDTFMLDTQAFLPDGISLQLLTNEYLDLVDSTWPHRYPTSASYFELLINLKSGYGLFADKTLLAWVLINESGNLLHLYTAEGHRQKGYAELLLKSVSNVLIKEGRIVNAYCLLDNHNACKLYRKAGFHNSGEIAWVYLKAK
ncbi:hypothetical protein HW555_000031 [Spodoptera exigua]|uniref:N-acetyltransferase domain-containing protein n=1 Tax=Spodoptera exigua TaxID=7107 RepID=A0A835GS61_SPOEX|nr:hypothetical protein HW555_000031 [Spodoptera exigua]